MSVGPSGALPAARPLLPLPPGRAGPGCSSGGAPMSDEPSFMSEVVAARTSSSPSLAPSPCPAGASAVLGSPLPLAIGGASLPLAIGGASLLEPRRAAGGGGAPLEPRRPGGAGAEDRSCGRSCGGAWVVNV